MNEKQPLTREVRIEARTVDNMKWHGVDGAKARRMATAYEDRRDADAKEEAWNAHLAGEQANHDAAERARKAAEYAAGEKAQIARDVAAGEEAIRIAEARQEALMAERDSRLTYVQDLPFGFRSI